MRKIQMKWILTTVFVFLFPFEICAQDIRTQIFKPQSKEAERKTDHPDYLKTSPTPMDLHLIKQTGTAVSVDSLWEEYPSVFLQGTRPVYVYPIANKLPLTISMQENQVELLMKYRIATIEFPLWSTKYFLLRGGSHSGDIHFKHEQPVNLYSLYLSGAYRFSPHFILGENIETGKFSGLSPFFAWNQYGIYTFTLNSNNSIQATLKTTTATGYKDVSGATMMKHQGKSINFEGGVIVDKNLTNHSTTILPTGVIHFH
jgi:hypothetical protein